MLIKKEREHLIGVAAYLAAGLLTLADVAALTSVHRVAGIAIMGYLFLSGLWAFYKVPVQPRSERVRLLRELVRATTIAMFLSFGAGFWAGFSEAFEAGIKVELAHYQMSAIFGAVSASLAVMALVSGVGHVAFRDGYRDGDEDEDDEYSAAFADGFVDP